MIDLFIVHQIIRAVAHPLFCIATNPYCYHW